MPPLNLVGDFGGGGMLLAFGHGLRAARAPSAPARARSSTPPWSTAPPSSPRCSTPSGPWASGTTSGAPTCSTPAPTSTTSTRPPTASTSRSARSSRSSTPSSSELTGFEGEELPWQQDRAAVAGAQGADGRDLQGQDPRRVVRAHGGHRRLLRPGAVHGRGARAPAQRPPRHVPRARRRHPAGARASLLAHTGRRAAPAVPRRPAHRRGVGRLGRRPRPHREAEGLGAIA